jgi:predicted pyridoxine 5'-phosphate oxidase superfamily flavin-nucleotide-binding protein
MLAAEPGFVSSPDERTLHINGGMLAGDPLEGQLHVGDHVGGLGLEPTTRRRNRVNGEIVAADEGGLRIAVTQSFGNCPQYIQHRQHSAAPDDGHKVQSARRGADGGRPRTDRARRYLLHRHRQHERGGGRGRGVDVSHRGGRPGFVRIDDERTLTSPEFVGNFFFNTLGNVNEYPRAGLLFIDFERGDMLHIAVDAEIIWDGPQLQAFAGAERLLRFHVREVVRNVAALPFRWTDAQPAMQVARTGSWARRTARKRRRAVAKLARIQRGESGAGKQRRALVLPRTGRRPGRGGARGRTISLAARAGVGRGGGAAGRSYTISDAANGRSYRISVKRAGVVSSWLHDHLAPGGQIELMGPAGDFV